MAVHPAVGGAHDGDDLFDLRRIGRVAQTLVAGSVAGMESRQRRRRPTSPSTIKQKVGHDPSSSSWNEPDYRRQSTLRLARLGRRAIASDIEQESKSIRDGYRGCLDAIAGLRLFGPRRRAIAIRPKR
jgi:hypothetical protein